MSDYPRYSYMEYDDGTIIMLDTGEVLPPDSDDAEGAEEEE